MYGKILVPLDGSKTAEKILPHVEEFAARFKSKVILVQIVKPAADMVRAGLFTRLPDQLNADKKQAESYLSGIRKRLQDRQIDSEVEIIVSSSAIEAITEKGEREKVDLIAMSSHGHSGLSRVFYGSVAAGVLHRVDRPLLIIRALEEE